MSFFSKFGGKANVFFEKEKGWATTLYLLLRREQRRWPWQFSYVIERDSEIEREREREINREP